jgi:hypothetical protein
MSGLMTACFLLHLRKWEAKDDTFTTTNNGVLEFASKPSLGATRPYGDDFGDDPVYHAAQDHVQHVIY